MGHQLLSQALGGSTFRLKSGHPGATTQFPTGPAPFLLGGPYTNLQSTLHPLNRPLRSVLPPPHACQRVIVGAAQQVAFPLTCLNPPACPGSNACCRQGGPSLCVTPNYVPFACPLTTGPSADVGARRSCLRESGLASKAAQCSLSGNDT